MREGPLVPELPLGDIRIAHRFDYNALMSQLGESRLSRAVEQPNAEGALGRNKAGYFHVRFQFAMASISDFAIVAERLDALEAFRDVVNYSFNHQVADGSFEFSAPSELTSQPKYMAPGIATVFTEGFGVGILWDLKSARSRI